MKFLVIALLVGLMAFFAVQPRARLTFPDYDKINNFDEPFFASDFRSPSACEEGLAYFRPLPGQTASLARCPYAPRYHVWGLKAWNIANHIGALRGVFGLTTGYASSLGNKVAVPRKISG